MKRIYPARIRDKMYLSRLLEQLLIVLYESPLHVHVRALSFDSQIPECIFVRLQNLHRNPEDTVNITAEDYHILFANILFRFPTIRVYELPDQTVFFKM